MLTSEQISCSQGPPLVERWLKHVQGALKMVQMRGVEQLQTPVGLELFITVLRMQMVYRLIS
jgi:hypothetical protein